MSRSSLTRCDPRLLDFVTWAVLKGSRMFQRVHITPRGLVATGLIPEYDFVAIVPTSAAVSVVSVSEDTNFPLKVSTKSYGNLVPFWPDLNYGSFAVVGYLARAMLTGHPRGIQSYLDVLPFDQGMPIGRVADQAQRSPEYVRAIRPLVTACKVRDDELNLALRHAYCLFRRHAIPFWTWTSAGGVGHPSFQNTSFGREGKGDIYGMVPIIDLALHSPQPNAAVGFPDAEMVQWLKQERKLETTPGKGYFVMQALRDIQEGEVITVDKNIYFGFDDDTFKAWFGFPNESQVVNVVSSTPSPPPPPPQSKPKPNATAEAPLHKGPIHDDDEH